MNGAEDGKRRNTVAFSRCLCYNKNRNKRRGSDTDGRSGRRYPYDEKTASMRLEAVEVLRTGMDFKLSCVGCGHEVMLPRSKAEKNIRSIEREGETIC